MKLHENHLLPDKLYKYRKIDENLFNNINDRTFWLSCPNEFNDPFDSHALIDSNKIFLGKTYNDDALVEIQRNHKTRSFVSCFTEKFYNRLMWSHYAENHKGICIEYDMSMVKNANEPFGFHKVKYKDKLLDLTKFTAEMIDKGSSAENILTNLTNMFVFKDKIWRYEKEWRFIQPKGKHMMELEKGMNMEAPPISAIYLGANIKNISLDQEKILLKIIDLSLDLKYGFKSYIMKLEPRQYKLKHELISEEDLKKQLIDWDFIDSLL